MMKDFVGIILAGGFGSRMLPATKAINKALLPVYSHEGAVPMICYPCFSLISCGIERILIISSQEHCGRIIEFFGDGSRLGVDFTYKIQDMNNPKKPPGIASALKIAKDFTHDNKFAVILGDNFFRDSMCDYADAFITSEKSAHLFLKEVDDPRRFGCATLEDGEITNIVEKPKKPRSNLAVTGLYFFTKHVYSVAEQLQVSGRGELEITDINQYYVKKRQVSHSVLPNYWSDMGTPQSMLRTQEFIEADNFKVNYK